MDTKQELFAMFYLFLTFWLLPAFCKACALLPDDAKPKGLEERSLDSEIVIAAYTRAVYRTRNNTINYSAEFLVFNIIKGEEHVVELYQKRKPSELETVLNRRLVNVSNFGDPSKCDADVNPNETYILFLDVLVNGELTARYDGAYGPAVLYSRDKEMALEAIGSSPWTDWSPCSGSCGGGIQQRRRQCEGSSKCSNEEGQQRTCNMFPCQGILNVLEAAGVHRSSLHPTGRPSAYKLLPSGSWRSLEEEITFPRTFPWEFSLLLTVRVKSSSSGGFLLRVLHSGSLQVGLYLSDKLTLVLSDKDNIRVSFVKSLFDDHWHQIAFSVRRNTVSFYLDCEHSAKLPLPGKIRPFGMQSATIIVGSTGEHELDAFQGDVEQITVTGSPDAAEKQCNSTTQPFHSRSGTYALRQEIRTKPTVSSRPQNDQLPLRGDIIIDDEDFSFEDPGSGQGSPKTDDDYDDYDEKETTTKDKIPLKSENDDVEHEDDDDEDYDDENEKDVNDKGEIDKEESDKVESDKDDYDNEKMKSDDDEDYVKAKDDDDEDYVKAKDDVDEDNEKKKDNDYDKFTKKDDEEKNSKENDEKFSIENKIVENDKNENKKIEEFRKVNDTIKSPEIDLSTIHKEDVYDYDEKWNFDLKNTDKSISNISIDDKSPEHKSEITYDFSHSDEEDDNEDDNIEGSGSQPKVELAWSEWSPCSSTCNWGRRTRTSYCLDNGVDLEKCSAISSKRSETEACFLRLCPSTTTTPAAFISLTPPPILFNISGVSLKHKCKVNCKNGGTCQPPYKCLCKPGFYGSLCQYEKQSCRVNCRNGGSCLPPSTCICLQGFYGRECEFGCGKGCPAGKVCHAKTNECKCSPGYVPPTCTALCKPQCMNGGACVAPNTCSCKFGYVGKSCHKAICQQGCKNGGECVAPNKCACRSGFTGKDCSKPYCEPACENGGECVKPYFCHCPSGTKGAFCEKLMCKPDCQNGGMCVGPGKCACLRGYSGHSCEQAYCPGGCFNGGKCNKSGKCTCDLGYTGTRCEKKKPCKFVEIKEPFKRGYKQKVTTQVKVPCGAWGWKLCTKTKVHYEMVYKTFYRTSYECEGFQKSKYSEYKKE